MIRNIIIQKIVTALTVSCSTVSVFLLLGIRSLLGAAECRYTISCTQFAIQQLKEQNIIVALWNITKRILACNPLSKKPIELDIDAEGGSL